MKCADTDNFLAKCYICMHTGASFISGELTVPSIGSRLKLIIYNMKISLVLSILLLVFVAGCACPGAPSEPTPLPPSPAPVPPPAPTPTPPPSPPPPEPYAEYAIQLAKKFCPVIHLNGEAEARENFDPDPVQLMVDLSLLRDLETPAFSEKPSVSDLRRWSQSAYYLDVANLDPKINTVGEYKAAYEPVKASYQPTIYVRVKEGTDYTVVQYWLFYYFNDWRNLHEGDWELVQLNFPGYMAKELLEREESPVFAAYSQHQAGQKMSWNGMQAKELVMTGTHPIVYIAQGSHANYFSPGQFWSGLDFDDTGISLWRVIEPEELDVVLLREAEKEGTEWLDFQGYWGKYLGFSISVLGLKFQQRGPFGPQWGEGGNISRKWVHPETWATELPECPKPFWTSFLDIPGDLSKLAVFSLFSPADLHIYDSLGRHVGINEKGQLERQIPEAIYITPEGTQYKTIVIPNADVSQEYTMVVKGTGSGTIELKAHVPDSANKVKRYLEYKNVPVSRKTKARIKILPDVALRRATPQSNSARDKMTKLELDNDGDGVYEIESIPGNFEKEKVVRPTLKVNIDIEPDTIELTKVVRGEAITAYIELPAEYDPKTININTVRLMSRIPALEEPIDVVDHDQDGINELKVQFDRQLLIEHLKNIGQMEGVVNLTLTGVMDGRPFEGEATINVSGSLIK